MEKNNLKKLATLGAGIGIGAGLGVLLAPKSGKETREDIKNKLHDIRLKIEHLDKKEVKKEFHQKIAEIENDLDDLNKEKVLKIAKKKAKEIQDKIDDFVSLAKEKGNKAIMKSAQNLRANAIDVTKKVLEKLEQNEE